MTVTHGGGAGWPAAGPQPDVGGRPRSHALAGGRVLACAGYDNSIRWRRGERLEHLFEERCDSLSRAGLGGQLAVDGGDYTLSYLELEGRANQLAHFLLGLGVRAGDRVGLLFDQAVDGYVGMLAALKLGAAYVPLDIGFPADRLAYIISDAGVRLVLSASHLESHAVALGGPGQVRVLYLNELRHQIGAQSPRRLPPRAAGHPVDDLCYVIYTSGSTGMPKGVAVDHASICNFVLVAAEVYGFAASDRVYQGMTIAFDFSVEEIWIPWMAGATLVPKPGGTALLGPELHDFLSERRVTALCCVPTLLATLDAELPGLRFLLVSGESCPHDLVVRWYRPGRRFLNVYGPTEATVTATWTVLHPDRPVTIGVPLPTYFATVLDPDDDAVLVPGELGEIGVAGIGLARGYLNKPDLTARAFIPDFLAIPGNPSGRIYRTGDLGRINADGEIEHHGRIDTQVKIRGYRVELTEIESVLLAMPGVAQAVVDAFRPEPGIVELVGYYSLRDGMTQVPPKAIYDHLRKRLPGYMVPGYLERLAAVPTLPSGKADRKNLPAPRGQRRLAGRDGYAGPSTATERVLAGLLAEVLGVDRVSVDAHFFNELGASSLLMARFNAEIRARPGLPAVSMRDVYQHLTIRRLAAALDAAVGAERAKVGRPSAVPARPGTGTEPVGTPRYVLCGLLQMLAFAAYGCAVAVVLDFATAWVSAGAGLAEVGARAVLFGATALLAAGIAPIAAKWLLIGRWKEQRIRVWSMPYLRFWIVKTLTAANPAARLCVGTPLYPLYLRALGARIGPGVAIFTTHMPACADLLTIGAGSVIRKDASVRTYRARSGVIETGRVILGAEVFIGEATLIDLGTAMGDGAQLGHSSALLHGQSVPAGEYWHGSPARPAGPGQNDPTVRPVQCGRLRRASYGAGRLAIALLLAGPASVAVASLLLSRPSPLARLLSWPDPASWALYRDALLLGGTVLLGFALAGLVVAATVPRLLSRALQPGIVYPLYGVRYTIQRLVSLLSNVGFFTALFGDSSAIVAYLRVVGYRLAPVEQTGSNFGMAVKHEVPGLAIIGTGTMVSDGLSLINAEFSASSFRLRPTVVGAGNFLGNNIAYPADSRVGDNCLLGTKVMVPTTGPVRTGVGLLGSPCFEIPRSATRDPRFDHLTAGSGRQRGLAAKNRHNAVTMGLFLLVRWLYLAGLCCVALIPLGGSFWLDVLSTTGTMMANLAFTVGYFAMVERAVLRFRPMKPQYCSIYQPEFWRHERFWKVPSTGYVQMFNGTPVKPVIWRLLGARVGRRVFDDGCALVERTLVSIGDECTLNSGSVLQGHSLEDGIFTSDRISIGAGATLGAGAFVHYGTRIGDGAWVDADSFLMKGEQVPPFARWLGNPAAEVESGRSPGHDRAANRAATGAAIRPGPGRHRRRPAGRRQPRQRLSAGTANGMEREWTSLRLASQPSAVTADPGRSSLTAPPVPGSTTSTADRIWTSSPERER